MEIKNCRTEQAARQIGETYLLTSLWTVKESSHPKELGAQIVIRPLRTGLLSCTENDSADTRSIVLRWRTSTSASAEKERVAHRRLALSLTLPSPIKGEGTFCNPPLPRLPASGGGEGWGEGDYRYVDIPTVVPPKELRVHFTVRS